MHVLPIILFECNSDNNAIHIPSHIFLSLFHYIGLRDIRQLASLTFTTTRQSILGQLMAGSLSLILLCLQVVSTVLGNSDPSAQIHRRSPQKPSKPPVSNTKANAKPVPFGFGSKVTGGGNAAPQTPKDPAELEAWLNDPAPRVILISKTYDFTSPNITKTSGCQPFKSCSNGKNVQQAMNYNNWCTQVEKSTSKVLVSLDASPLNPIMVAGHKTLLGVGKSAIIKGKGLSLIHVENVIIQNIHITWLNPHLVWGGDALMMYGAKNVWIDHCTFSSIGRQMIVAGGTSPGEGNSGITISNNFFSGKTKWSARCQNRHYWTAFFSGVDDQITMARNCIDFTSGRSPKTGGSGSPKVLLHYYNNMHTNTIGATFEVGAGSNVLAEGNVFHNVKMQDNSDLTTQDGGKAYVPFKTKEANQCKSILGRPCISNLMIQSSKYNFPLDTQALATCKVRGVFTHCKLLFFDKQA
ncbi:hypothetical protein PGTUg99_030176 [Puccinia graminis f. sp. tritici]|uniref:pectin lyase n=1 Tax=Puccinia graminis f. sp. tritici TaxID=56615 RepID=A0A5B0RUF9_PUCGR|nr:hypothetical protein PGTUg99_030176 [Puccinia graminis f. sp. tritici]